MVGTFTALAEHYLAWKDPYPVTLDELATERGKPVQHLSEQEILVAGGAVWVTPRANGSGPERAQLCGIVG